MAILHSLSSQECPAVAVDTLIAARPMGEYREHAIVPSRCHGRKYSRRLRRAVPHIPRNVQAGQEVEATGWNREQARQQLVAPLKPRSRSCGIVRTTFHLLMAFTDHGPECHRRSLGGPPAARERRVEHRRRSHHRHQGRASPAPREESPARTQGPWSARTAPAERRPSPGGSPASGCRVRWGSLPLDTSTSTSKSRL